VLASVKVALKVVGLTLSTPPNATAVPGVRGTSATLAVVLRGCLEIGLRAS